MVGALAKKRGGQLRDGSTPVAAPKVNADTMREAQPLYIEPEVTDAVTDAAAAISLAATGAVPRLPPPVELPSQSLVERLGLTGAGGPREGDDGQDVGPTR